MMPSPLAYRDPRRFSPARLSSHSRAEMQRLALDLEDIRYTFTWGARLRSAGGGRLFIVLRRKDIPPVDRALERVRRREGVVLHLDRHGWIVHIERDRRAFRRLRSHRGEPIPRPRHTRLG
jgi:hypothetical protein